MKFSGVTEFGDRRVKCCLKLAVLGLAVLLVGCKDAIDRQVDTGLAKVAADRARKPHYPILKLADFGPDNGPEGIETKVYGNYTEVHTKSNPELAAIGESQAIQALAKEYELAVAQAQAAQASTPPPSGPQGGPDWKHALHPPIGSYTVQTTYNNAATTFTVVLPSKPGQPNPAAVSDLNKQLQSEAASEVKSVKALEDAALADHKIPPGFQACTDELVKSPRGARDPDPHIFGLPLLITPIGPATALKGLETAVRSLVDKTSKLKSKPTTATVQINCPLGLVEKKIDLSSPATIDQGVQALMQDLAKKIDTLNKGAK